MTGTLEGLRATKRLASSTKACPPWCDHQHDLTGDDQGIEHTCTIISPTDHRGVEAYLRSREMLDSPGRLGPVSLAVFTTGAPQLADEWFVEVALDSWQLGGLEEAIQRTLTLVNATLHEAEDGRLICDLNNVDCTSAVDIGLSVLTAAH